MNTIIASEDTRLDRLNDILSIDLCFSIKGYADEIYQIRQELNKTMSDESNSHITSKIKGRVQEEANRALDMNNGSGLILAATGVGKSKIAIDRVNTLLNSDSYAKILLVVPTEKLRDEGWLEEFKKWGFMNSWTFIDRTCYASLHKNTNNRWDLVILDELHNITEYNEEFFTKQGNTADNIIALTATEPTNFVKQSIIERLGIKTVYSIDVDTSVKLGLIAPYNITVIKAKLNSVSKNVKAGSKEKPFMTTERANYDYLNRICLRGNKFLYLKRMRFIYNLPTKTNAARYILESLIPKDIRTLIFCGSIEQAEIVCINSYHSKSDDIKLGLFKKSKINRLSCVMALNEGENIDGIDCGFIVQLNSSNLDLVQRIGRIIRYRSGHIGRIIILVVEETVDWDWFRKATKGLDQANIRIVGIADLVNGNESINF